MKAAYEIETERLALRVFQEEDVEAVKWFWGDEEVMRYCLGGVKRIHASVDLQNADSSKILEKIGFTYAGTEWFEDAQQEESVYEIMLK